MKRPGNPKQDTPTQIIKSFVEKNIKTAQNVVIIWDDGETTYMDHSDMTNKDLFFLVGAADAQMKKEFMED